jgi:uncharacterized membrane protein YdbT with pleckstrin-like domain
MVFRGLRRAASIACRYAAVVDLHPGEQVVYEGHPTWRALLAFYVSSVGGAIVVGVVVALVASVGVGILVGAALLGLALLVGFVRRMATVYMVSTQRLYIRRGILSKRVQQTRIDRVQNVNTDQSLLDRILRVGKVDFDTAGTDDSDFVFVGISHPDRVVAAVDRAQRDATPPVER